MRVGLKALLRSVPDINVVGEASGGDEAVAVAAGRSPHVVVMDLEMPLGDGARATRALAAFDRPPHVLILTMHTEESRLLELLELGASGFLMKDAAGR
ncbi:MAG: response regulator, partial [Gemmatimonadaceae bacterium]